MEKTNWAYHPIYKIIFAAIESSTNAKQKLKGEDKELKTKWTIHLTLSYFGPLINDNNKTPLSTSWFVE